MDYFRGTTYKLPFDTCLNHPCGKDNQIEITSQNHGFAIDPDSLSNDMATQPIIILTIILLQD